MTTLRDFSGEILEEVRINDIEDKRFRVVGVNGESMNVDGSDLYKGILTLKKMDLMVFMTNEQG